MAMKSPQVHETFALTINIHTNFTSKRNLNRIFHIVSQYIYRCLSYIK